MNIVEHLSACAGRWRGSSHLQDPERSLSDRSPSTLEITPVLNGRFVRMDYTWGYEGRPQEGTMLVGCSPSTGADSIHWADTWHMGHLVMSLTGPSQGAAALAVTGTYAAPPGPDWGWRIELDLSNPRTLRLRMHNIHPDGKEEVAVDASYAKD